MCICAGDSDTVCLPVLQKMSVNKVSILVVWHHTSQLYLLRVEKAALGEHKPSTDQLEMKNNVNATISADYKNSDMNENEYKIYPWWEKDLQL